MAVEEEVQVRMGVAGGREVADALRGAARELRRQSTDMERESKRAAKQRVDEAKRVAKETSRIWREELQEFRRLERAKRSEMEQTSREARRRDDAMRRERDLRQRTGFGGRTGRAIDTFGGAGAMLGGAVVGLGGQVLNAASSAYDNLMRGWSSQVRPVSETIRSGAELRRSVRYLAGEAAAPGATEADIAARTDAAVERILQVSEQTGIAAPQLAGALQIGQVQFSSFDEALANLSDLARAAAASGESVEELTQAQFALKEVFGLTTEEVGNVLPILRQAGREGRVTPGQFVSNFLRFGSGFRAARGTSGEGAFREYVAAAQVIARSNASVEESSTRLSNLVGELANPRTQQRIREETGINVVGADGYVRGLPELLDEFQASGKFRTSTDIQSVIKEERAARGLMDLLQYRNQAGQASLTDLMNVSSSEGRANLEQAFAGALTEAATRQDILGAQVFAADVRDLGGRAAAVERQAGAVASEEQMYPMVTKIMEAMPFLSTFRGLSNAFVGGNEDVSVGERQTLSTSMLAPLIGPLAFLPALAGTNDEGQSNFMNMIEDLFGTRGRGIRLDTSGAPMPVNVVSGTVSVSELAAAGRSESAR